MDGCRLEDPYLFLYTLEGLSYKKNILVSYMVGILFGLQYL